MKNVINTFTKTASNNRVRFVGNLALGEDVSLHELRESYNAVILVSERTSTLIECTKAYCLFLQCYGAAEDRKLNIPNEVGNVLSAREFVAWYNGLPGANMESVYATIENDLRRSHTVSIVGQGNVAVDVARILLTSIDALRLTDITARALNTLAECKVDCVHLIGRRGPLQAAYTIKELREMLKLPNVATKWRTNDFDGIDNSIINDLPRPKRRITELMLKSVPSQLTGDRLFAPIFFRSPKAITFDAADPKRKLFELTANRLSDSGSAIPTNSTETIETDLIFRSIGYKGVNVCRPEDSLNFDTAKGLVPNDCGRVLHQNGTAEYERGLYVSGWLGIGPVGVILTTMSNSFLVAETLCKDWQEKAMDVSAKPGLNFDRFENTVSWEQWQKIDQAEVSEGTSAGKPREKILDISKMLNIAH